VANAEDRAVPQATKQGAKGARPSSLYGRAMIRATMGIEDSSPTIVLQKMVFVGLFLCLLLFPGAYFQPSSVARADTVQADQENVKSNSPADRTQLEQDVAKLVAGDEVQLRRDIDKLFMRAGILEKEGKDEQALQLYKKALSVNAANIPGQMKLARLLAKHKQPREAKDRAAIVQEMGEDEALVQEAEELLKSLAKNRPSPRRKPISVDRNVEITLIPLGKVNHRVLSTLRDMLEQRMGIRITILPTTKDIGKPDRSLEPVFIEDYFRWLKARIGETDFDSVVSELGFTKRSMESSQSKRRFIESLFEHWGVNGQKARQDFETGLKNATNQMQYDTTRLLDELQKEFPLQKKSRIKGYLAVTNNDIYQANSRFHFGAALTGHAVMSLCRFTADFNQEDQNRPRLVKRAVKQALSSANFVLGIPRCANPNCARAYPHSLQELDQKPDTLCSVCQERLRAYRQSARR
jgi:predicted Zn-dependent protease